MRVQHSATTIHFFTGFNVAALPLSSFWDYCKKLWFLLCFLFGCEEMNTEQWINLMFLVRYGKLLLKLSSCFKKFMEMIQCQDLGCLSCTRGFKKEERMLKLISRAGGHQQAGLVKISSLWQKKFAVIVTLLFWW